MIVKSGCVVVVTVWSWCGVVVVSCEERGSKKMKCFTFLFPPPPDEDLEIRSSAQSAAAICSPPAVCPPAEFFRSGDFSPTISTLIFCFSFLLLFSSQPRPPTQIIAGCTFSITSTALAIPMCVSRSVVFKTTTASKTIITRALPFLRGTP